MKSASVGPAIAVVMMCSLENATVISMTTVSAAEARRLALVAQGFGSSPRGTASQSNTSPTRSPVSAFFNSIRSTCLNASHYLPLFLDSALMTPLSSTTCCSTHMSPPHTSSTGPMRPRSFRLSRGRCGSGNARSRQQNAETRLSVSTHRQLANELLVQTHSEGPATFSQLEGKRDERRGSWWDWSDVKRALEYLFEDGVITGDWPDQLPANLRSRGRCHSSPSSTQASTNRIARRALVLDAVRALGVGVLADIADYYRFKVAPTKVALGRS